MILLSIYVEHPLYSDMPLGMNCYYRNDRQYTVTTAVCSGSLMVCVVLL